MTWRHVDAGKYTHQYWRCGAYLRFGLGRMKGSVSFFLRAIGGRGLGAPWLGAYIDNISAWVINGKVTQEHDTYTCSWSRR